MTDSEIFAATTAFSRALATMKHGDDAWQALHGLADALVGTRLFTVMTIDWANERAGRVFTSHPEAYPVAGSKPIRYDGWFDIVHRDRQTYVANTIEAMKAHFPDHQTIASLGCGSIVNLPIEIAGAMVGTVNLLHEKSILRPRASPWPRISRCRLRPPISPPGISSAANRGRRETDELRKQSIPHGVIPANAGIHLPSTGTALEKRWIPAFAGMTLCRGAPSSNHPALTRSGTHFC